MNLSTAIFLVNKEVYSVRVSYDPDVPKNNNPDVYFKTLDASVVKDDYVIVPTKTRHGFTVCKVEETRFRVDFDSHREYNWIVGKVDKAAYDSILKQEAIVLDRIGDAEENRKRAELQTALGLATIDLTDLDIVSNASAALPAPSSPRGQPFVPSPVPDAPAS